MTIIVFYVLAGLMESNFILIYCFLFHVLHHDTSNRWLIDARFSKLILKYFFSWFTNQIYKKRPNILLLTYTTRKWGHDKIPSQGVWKECWKKNIVDLLMTCCEVLEIIFLRGVLIVVFYYDSFLPNQYNTCNPSYINDELIPLIGKWSRKFNLRLSRKV